jgi:hypothetical protein
MLLVAAIQIQKAHAEGVEIVSLSVNPGSENLVNSPIFLSAAVANTDGFSRPFVAVFEVRDHEGSTVFVKLEAGTLAPEGQLAPRTFWVPDTAGEYVARVFVISSISEPEVLSPAQSAAFSVQESSQPEPPPAVFSLREAPSSSLIYQLKLYALEKINADREKFGLEPVEFSHNIAAQKHAEDMLATKIPSYWTTGGEKPYMAYSRYGGLGAVAQNVVMSGSLEYYADCASGEHMCDTVDPFEQVDLHQYGMVYIDAECCGDAHRSNILDPFHTHASIGIAFDDYTFVMVENFENNYIELDQQPAKRANYVELAGSIPRGEIRSISVHYDEKPSLQAYEQNRDAPYGMGELVAAVVPPDNSTSQEIAADYWAVERGSIEIGFSLNSVNQRDGVYTIVVVFEDKDGNVFSILSYSL